MGAVIAAKGQREGGCFKESTGVICGNGIIEGDEQCDCGFGDDCADECCNDGNTPEGIRCTLKNRTGVYCR
jgi:disintegrin and metalloproteinase domain-containing protein 10